MARRHALPALLVAMTLFATAEGMSGDDSVEADLAKVGESLSLGESSQAPVQVAPNMLAAQNQQLQGAIAAIEGGTPPAGMEAMVGGPSAPGGEVDGGGAAGGAKSESAAISKGIKMAMSSVKPLMDKYVATARALTDKYTKLQAKYKEVKAESEACPTEEQVQGRIDVAVKAAKDAVRGELDPEITKLKVYIQKLKNGDAGALERLTAKVAKMQAFEKQADTDFRVQVKLAKTKAKANMDLLHDQLKAMMLSELKKRDKVLELRAEKKQKQKIGQAAKKELADKKAAASREAEGAVKRKANEKIEKKEEAREVQTKNDAAEEVKTLNRDTVMRKARKAMNAARHAAHMARTVVRDTARSLDDARLEAAKASAVEDVKAMAKLRHHQDLAIMTVDSAAEKQQKVSRYEFTAKNNLHAARVRADLVAKKNRFEDRRTRTLKRLALKASYKAQLLTQEAKDQARAVHINAKRIVALKKVAAPVENVIIAAESKKKGDSAKGDSGNADASAEIAKLKKQVADQKAAAEQATEIAKLKLEVTKAKREAAAAAAKQETKQEKEEEKEEEKEDEKEEPTTEASKTASKAASKAASTEAASKKADAAEIAAEKTAADEKVVAKIAEKKAKRSAEKAADVTTANGASQEEADAAQDAANADKKKLEVAKSDAADAETKAEEAKAAAAAKAEEAEADDKDAAKAKEKAKEPAEEEEKPEELKKLPNKLQNKDEVNKGKSVEAIKEAIKEKTGLEEPGTEQGNGKQEKKREEVRADAENSDTKIAEQIKKTEKEIEEVDAGNYTKTAPAPPLRPSKVPELKSDDSKKTLRVKMQAVAANAMLQTQLAQAKLLKAKKLRMIARNSLKEKGKPIPKSLTKASLKSTEDKLAEAKKRADKAVREAKDVEPVRASELGEDAQDASQVEKLAQEVADEADAAIAEAQQY